MKRFMPVLLSSIVFLSGCNAGQKSSSLTAVYAVAAVLSLLILVGYCCAIRKRNVWFVTLFSSVLVVNVGYLCLALSWSLPQALMANRIAYLGSVLLPMSMFVIILNVTGTKYKKNLKWILGAISAVVFLVAASPGILDIYYKEVSFEIVNGVSTLVKVYGPWHSLYLIYLLGYFVAMVTVIVRSGVKKTIAATSYAVILAIAVFVNLGVWFIEQLVDIDFEMLSISYIISELFLLGVHLVMSENQRLKEIVKQKEEMTRKQGQAQMEELPSEVAEQFRKGIGELTPKERDLFSAYIAGESTKEILERLNIKENTLKFHSKNLYTKLGVNSRKQLVAIHRQLEK